MKKFYVKDEEGEDFTVEEFEEHEQDSEPEELTADEILSLKKLAAHVDKILEIVNTAEHDAKDDEDIEEKEEVEEIEDSDEKEEKEEIIETDKTKGHDSIKAFGSIERNRKIKTDDSLEERELAIANAWAKRYGGKN